MSGLSFCPRLFCPQCFLLEGELGFLLEGELGFLLEGELGFLLEAESAYLNPVGCAWKTASG